jgi:hypothetical protein
LAAIECTDLLRLEKNGSVDFNGDKAIGDSVASILSTPARDNNGDGLIAIDEPGPKGEQLVRLTSGAVAVDFSGEATAGSSAGSVVTLKLSTGANWAPPVTTATL